MATSKLAPRCTAVTNTFTLPLRPRHTPAHPISIQNSQSTQSRHASSTRRTRKLLNIPPAASFGGPPAPATGSSGRSRLPPRYALPRTAQMIFNPPSSAPNVYHTPNIFLPKEDARRRAEKTLPSDGSVMPLDAPSAIASTSTSWMNLPPSLDGREEWKKSYHLTPEKIEEIRRLRESNEDVWTVRKLAREFHCSRQFITTVVLASKEKRKRLDAKAETKRAKWTDRKIRVWQDRRKRKAMWERDE